MRYCVIVCRLVNFDLRLGYLDERLDSFDEGVEFAFRLCNLTSTEHSNWIPIRFYTNNTIDDRRNFIFIGNKSSHDKVLLRGYNVSYQVGHVHQVQVKLCDRGIAHSDFIQFRWLQTVRLNKEGADRVTLDNVTIVHNSSNLEQLVVLLEDNFNNQTAIEYVASYNYPYLGLSAWNNYGYCCSFGTLHGSCSIVNCTTNNELDLLRVSVVR